MTAAPHGRLRKELRLLDVYAISTGAMFSSGFFLLPGLAAAQTGPSVTLAYLVAALFIMPAMFAVAELATAMPRAGGAYYFLDRSLGPLVGTVGGLGTWVALVFKSAFALVGMGAYLAIYMDVPMRPLAAALAVAFAIVNVVGAKETSGLQRVLVAALVGIMAVFVVDGLLAVGERGFVETTSERFTPFFAFGASGFLATVGFVFVAPMLAMGLYEAGRQIERGEKPTLGEMLYVRSAVRVDLAYLGLFLVLIYLLWGRIAQIVYGLSTYQLHRTVEDFVEYAIGTPDGQTMLLTGTLIGGAIAYLTYCAVVIAAPMLLDQKTGVFAAIVTSVRTVADNFWPMTLWAVILAVLVLISAATGFIALSLGQRASGNVT